MFFIVSTHACQRLPYRGSRNQATPPKLHFNIILWPIVIMMAQAENPMNGERYGTRGCWRPGDVFSSSPLWNVNKPKAFVANERYHVVTATNVREGHGELRWRWTLTDWWRCAGAVGEGGEGFRSWKLVSVALLQSPSLHISLLRSVLLR